MAEQQCQQKHFVLVHGACHGAWCWYRLIPLLESAGHKVTALDLAASGINLQNFTDIFTLKQWTAPLLGYLDSLGPDDKVIVVGHSFGGFSLALAMETYPEKIAVGVFLSAYFPNIANPPSTLLDEYFRIMPPSSLLDTQMITFGNPETPETAVLFGPKDLAMNVYEQSPVEALQLALSLVRPTSLLTQDLSRPNYFSEEGYGSVKRVYITTPIDRTLPLSFQRWQIENFSVEAVEEIPDADHMSMISRPQEVYQLLVEVGDKYA